MRPCYRCKLDKEEADFSPGNNRCRPCHKEYQQERRAKLAEKNQIVDLSGTKRCSTCQLEKPKTEFGLAKGISDGLQSQCNSCRAISRKAYNTSLKGHMKNMLTAARSRAKSCGRDFTLTTQEIEKLWSSQAGKCAVTGLTLELANSTEEHENSRNPFGPSIDRIESTGGYIAGNVRLVVTIANVAMNNWGETVMEDVLVSVLRKHDYVVNPPEKAIAPSTPNTVN